MLFSFSYFYGQCGQQAPRPEPTQEHTNNTFTQGRIRWPNPPLFRRSLSFDNLRTSAPHFAHSRGWGRSKQGRQTKGKAVAWAVVVVGRPSL